MEFGTRCVLHAMRRPDATLCFERNMVFRMPVSGKDHRQILLREHLYHLVEGSYDLVSVPNRKRSSRAEVTLDVNDDQRRRPARFHTTLLPDETRFCGGQQRNLFRGPL